MEIYDLSDYAGNTSSYDVYPCTGNPIEGCNVKVVIRVMSPCPLGSVDFLTVDALTRRSCWRWAAVRHTKAFTILMATPQPVKVPRSEHDIQQPWERSSGRSLLGSPAVTPPKPPSVNMYAPIPKQQPGDTLSLEHPVHELRDSWDVKRKRLRNVLVQADGGCSARPPTTADHDKSDGEILACGALLQAASNSLSEVLHATRQPSAGPKAEQKWYSKQIGAQLMSLRAARAELEARHRSRIVFGERATRLLSVRGLLAVRCTRKHTDLHGRRSTSGRCGRQICVSSPSRSELAL